MYNISLGGSGGWDYVNKTHKNIGFEYINSHKLNNKGKKISKDLREKLIKGLRLSMLNNPEKFNRSKECNPMYGKNILMKLENYYLKLILVLKIRNMGNVGFII